MPNRVQKLPLTAYDVIGYLVPGATFILMSIYVWHGLPAFVSITQATSTLGGAGLVLISVILSYVAGHVFALLSSFTIERKVLSITGYPSHHLIEQINAQVIVGNIAGKYWLTDWIVSILIFPISLLLKPVVRMGLIPHFAKKLDDHIIGLLDKKFYGRYRKHIGELNSSDWFKIVEYDVLNYSSIGSARMYNFLNLYGFCRNMSFVMHAIFLVCILRIFASPPAGPHFYFLALSLVLASGVLALGFMKFFRRYSHEAIMSFVVSVDERDKPKKPFQVLADRME